MKSTETQQLIYCEDVSRRIARMNATKESPFAGSLSYGHFFDLLARAIHRSFPRQIIVVRERGVGDHAVFAELARRCLEGCSKSLMGTRILMADVRRVPERNVLSAIGCILSEIGEAETTEAIVCLDGLATAIRGTRGESPREVLFTIARSPHRLVILLSPHEYEEWIVTDGDLQDLFSVIHLYEPEPDVAIKLVRHFAMGLQEHYKLHIDMAAIERAVMLSNSYVMSERLPSKAVRVLRAVCDDIAYGREELGRSKDRVTEADVIAKISCISGVPVQTLSGVGDRIDYHQSMSEMILGQDHAVREVARELGLIKAGFVDEGKPASVMLFIGQTGTGKTEMAKALAKFYSASKRLKTFTLGNFSEPHSVSGIIGVPAGYVGHDQGGRIVNELNSDPYGVFLLDEADKAHPDVMQPFLNLFDEGWICDQKGTKAYADRAIFILTTNVGQRQIADMFQNGKTVEEVTVAMKETLSKIKHTKSSRPVFTPEFLARVKRFIVFRTLDKEAMLGITRKLLKEIGKDWLTKRQKSLDVPDALVTAIGERAHAIDEKSHGKEGGRIVRKLIADVIESSVQRAISDNTEQYRSCACVRIGYAPPDGLDAAGATLKQLVDAVNVAFV